MRPTRLASATMPVLGSAPWDASSRGRRPGAGRALSASPLLPARLLALLRLGLPFLLGLRPIDRVIGRGLGVGILAGEDRGRDDVVPGGEFVAGRVLVGEGDRDLLEAVGTGGEVAHLDLGLERVGAVQPLLVVGHEADPLLARRGGHHIELSRDGASRRLARKGNLHRPLLAEDPEAEDVLIVPDAEPDQDFLRLAGQSIVDVHQPGPLDSAALIACLAVLEHPRALLGTLGTGTGHEPVLLRPRQLGNNRTRANTSTRARPRPATSSCPSRRRPPPPA